MLDLFNCTNSVGHNLELELELESNLHSNTIKIVNNLEMLRSAVQDIQISQKLLIECPSKD